MDKPVCTVARHLYAAFARLREGQFAATANQIGARCDKVGMEQLNQTESYTCPATLTSNWLATSVAWAANLAAQALKIELWQTIKRFATTRARNRALLAELLSRPDE